MPRKKKVIELEDVEGAGKYLPLQKISLKDAGIYTVIANMTDGSSAIAEAIWLVVKPRGVCALVVTGTKA